MLARHALGIEGERIAAGYLAAKGYRILGSRVRTAAGEIDLVATHGSEVVFIEVKTRRSNAFGTPEESITADKQRRLRLSAIAWLREQGKPAARYRIDVVGVLMPMRGAPTVTHTPSAVGGSNY